MFAMPGMRAFSLAARRGDGGVSFDADGVFVGDVALLKRSKACGANGGWAVRPIEVINHELTASEVLTPGYRWWDRPRPLGGFGGGGGGISPRQLQFPFPRFWSRPTITEVPPKPPSPPPRLMAPAVTEQDLPFSEGLPTQRAPKPPTENNVEGIPARGGRLGNAATRAQNAEEAAKLKKEGLRVTNGDDEGPEEYIPGEGPGSKGSTYVDLTAEDPRTGLKVRVQTIDTLADGVTPTKREKAAIYRIQKAFPNDELRIVPKRESR
jgi:hypothetical protein